MKLSSVLQCTHLIFWSILIHKSIRVLIFCTRNHQLGKFSVKHGRFPLVIVVFLLPPLTNHGFVDLESSRDSSNPILICVTDSLQLKLCFVRVSLRRCHFREVILHSAHIGNVYILFPTHSSPFNVHMLFSVAPAFLYISSVLAGNAPSQSSRVLIRSIQQHLQILDLGAHIRRPVH